MKTFKSVLFGAFLFLASCTGSIGCGDTPMPSDGVTAIGQNCGPNSKGGSGGHGGVSSANGGAGAKGTGGIGGIGGMAGANAAGTSGGMGGKGGTGMGGSSVAGSGGSAGSKAVGGTSGTGGSIAGASGTKGTAGQGGISGTGGNVAGSGGTMAKGGAGGSSTAMARPSYNTGVGFFVVGNKLYDANGIQFHMVGIDKLHWDFGTYIASAYNQGIPNTKANIVRWTIDFTQPTATNIALMNMAIAQKEVVMPGNWDATCDTDAASLSSVVDVWVAQASAWKPLERYMIINIANEWGFGAGPAIYGGTPGDTTWRDSYITAIGRLRAAGYLGTISITSGRCGQDATNIIQYGQAVFNSDPQKNIIFDIHIYGLWGDSMVSNPVVIADKIWIAGTDYSGEGLIDLNLGLTAMANTGLPIIVGEFGPGLDIGSSPTLVSPNRVMQLASLMTNGWIAWAWDDNVGAADNTWYDLCDNADTFYASSADLSSYGKIVVLDPTIGTIATAVPATIF